MKGFDHMCAKLFDDMTEFHRRTEFEFQKILNFGQIVEKEKSSTINLLRTK